MSRLSVFTVTAVVVGAAVAGVVPSAAASTLTTAWQHGTFAENTAGVVKRSDIVPGQPNLADTQYLPLGNGSLGVAEWAANGFTAQLNRADTMPGRLSPGQVIIPGLAALTGARDFTGRLDIYDGVLTESGGGMTLTAWVPAGQDELIVDVTGADPDSTQTASVGLWSGRTPTASAAGAVGTLTDSWVDSATLTGSGKTFGSVAAITAGGRDVTASVVNSEQVQVSFRPNADGAYRVVVAAPAWTSAGAAGTAGAAGSANAASTAGAASSASAAGADVAAGTTTAASSAGTDVADAARTAGGADTAGAGSSAGTATAAGTMGAAGMASSANTAGTATAAAAESSAGTATAADTAGAADTTAGSAGTDTADTAGTAVGASGPGAAGAESSAGAATAADMAGAARTTGAAGSAGAASSAGTAAPAGTAGTTRSPSSASSISFASTSSLASSVSAASAADRLLGAGVAAPVGVLLAAQGAWWHRFWASADLVEMSSSDGSADYLESIRTLYLYTEAASMGGTYPGSQAGVADMFNFSQDHQDWYPAGTWFWNLRTQLATNISSGNFALNLPIFNLYLNNLSNLQAWTKAQMGGLPGICIPETMRINGNGYQNDSTPDSDASCRIASSPTWNGETVTSGAELSLWIWQQYQDTGNLQFLRTYYPLMQQSAIFLLAYQKVGADGYLHAVANAHENQWAVQDPTTDLAADAALFPAVVSAAQLLHTDQSLVGQLTTAETEIEPYARTDEATLTQLLPPSADATGTDVIADSYQPTAPLHNVENTGLEPVWPYGVIGDDSGSLTALADRTYDHRPNPDTPDWSFDAVQAARLDMPDQVESNLLTLTEKYQAYISGMGSWQGGAGDEPYIEQAAAVGAAIDEALATDYDGTLRIAPAWPGDWDVAGTVSLRDDTTVDVQVQHGTVTTAALVVGAAHRMTIRSPWAGRPVRIVDGRTGAVIVPTSTSSTLTLNAQAGHTYLIQPVGGPQLAFAPVTGTPATQAKHLDGKVQIGLD